MRFSADSSCIKGKLTTLCISVESPRCLAGRDSAAVQDIRAAVAIRLDAWARLLHDRALGCFYTRYGPADVAELVDALGLGSSAARRGGSSPLIRTTISLTANALRACLREGGERSPAPDRALWEHHRHLCSL